MYIHLYIKYVYIYINILKYSVYMFVGSVDQLYCYQQRGLDNKEIHLNLCNILSMFIFNEFYFFA